MTAEATSAPNRSAHPSTRLATATLCVVAPALAALGWLHPPTGSTSATTPTFGFTGMPAAFAVPSGICSVRVEALGASGGEGGTAGSPGAGAQVAAVLRVTPGETLRVRVGGMGGAANDQQPGAGGWNGGGDGGAAAEWAPGSFGRAGSGGGGATDVRQGGDGPEHRVVVAGGGGGGAGHGIGGSVGTGGGSAGGADGVSGLAALGSANPATGGGGGSQSGGGPPGRNAPSRSVTATPGALGVGGNGADGGTAGGGGGGAGLYGGGGGGGEQPWVRGLFGGGHGGGGSSFGPPGSTAQAAVGAGPGRVRIGYDRSADGCAPVR